MPTGYQTHVDSLLTNFVKAYRNNKFVGDVLLPIKGVKKLSDLYAIYNRADSMSIPATELGPDGKAREVDYRMETGTYLCNMQGLKGHITKWDRENSDIPYPKQRTKKVKFIQDQLLLRLEYERAALLCATASYAAGNSITLAGTNQWNYSAADQTVNIVEDIDNGIKACAIRPNRMIIGQEVWDVMKRDVGLLEIIRYNERALLTPQVIASIFDLEEVVIASAYQATAAGVLSYIWGKNVILGYVEPPADESIMLGTTFAVGEAQSVRTWFDPAVGGGSEFFEVNWAWDPVIIANDCGYLIKDAIS